MSFVKIWVHLVFSTYNRNALLTNEVRRELLGHVRKNCKEKNIFLQSVNGYTEHLHCLVSLHREQTIAQVVQLVKAMAYIKNQEAHHATKPFSDEYREFMAKYGFGANSKK